MDELGVLRQHSACVTRWKRGPVFSAGLKLGGVYQQIERLGGDIDPNQVTVAHQSYWATISGFRSNVADTQSGCAA